MSWVGWFSEGIGCLVALLMLRLLPVHPTCHKLVPTAVFYKECAAHYFGSTIPCVAFVPLVRCVSGFNYLRAYVSFAVVLAYCIFNVHAEQGRSGVWGSLNTISCRLNCRRLPNKKMYALLPSKLTTVATRAWLPARTSQQPGQLFCASDPWYASLPNSFRSSQ